MAKTKRVHEDEIGVEVDDVHPSRKKRVKYSDEDAKLAKIYDDLADEVQDVRIKAAGDLIKNLSIKSSGIAERQDAAETRLIKGLCSGRKAARLGFSIALAELVRFRLKSPQGQSIDWSPILDKVLEFTTPHGNVSGQERRDHLLGRRFAFQSVLQSDIALLKEFPDQQWDKLVRLIFGLAVEKPWLRRECGSMLYEYLDSRGTKLQASNARCIIDVASEYNQLQTPEGVGLWLLIQKNFPEVKLPKGIWHHNNPLSSKERAVLSKVLLEDAVGDDSLNKKTGARQSNPSFVWSVILSHLFQAEDSKPFEKFWDACVASTMFSSTSSTERRSLGLQVTSLALSSAQASHLPTVLHPNIIRCILDQRAGPDRYLFEASKSLLGQIVSLAKQKPETAALVARELLFKGAINFDQASKTKTIESIIIDANNYALSELTQSIVKSISEAPASYGSQAENRCRMLADLLLTEVRLRKDSRTSLPTTLPRKDSTSETWLHELLQALSKFAYDESLSSPIQSVMRARLMSCLNSLMDAPLEQACKAPVYTAWLILTETPVPSKASQNANQAMQEAKSCLAKLHERHGGERSSQAFSLLFALGILQVYNDEPDAVAVLKDLIACCNEKDASADSTTMLVELLLSFISRPSSLFRKLAEQVFSVLAPEITAESLQSLTDILAQKESLSGQKELFDENHDEDEEQASDGEGNEAVDVEDVEDVELVNGEQASEQGVSDDESGSSSAAEEGADNIEEDEEAAFDKKLADALGTGGMNDDSDDDGSDMDDDQMMALEPHLTTIFKERQQTSSKKKDKKDAKENIVNFKNRVLDLLMIYVKAQHASVLALDLILPVTVLIRTTTSKPTAEKAFAVLKQYFESCNKTKRLPQPDNHEDCLALLAGVHDEMKLGGSKLHANACSRSSLFLAKVLVALDRKHYPKIAEKYSELQSEWYSDPKSKVQGSVFTEWASWSITTRKQR